MNKLKTSLSLLGLVLCSALAYHGVGVADAEARQGMSCAVPLTLPQALAVKVPKALKRSLPAKPCAPKQARSRQKALKVHPDGVMDTDTPDLAAQAVPEPSAVDSVLQPELARGWPPVAVPVAPQTEASSPESPRVALGYVYAPALAYASGYPLGYVPQSASVPAPESWACLALGIVVGYLLMRKK